MGYVELGRYKILKKLKLLFNKTMSSRIAIIGWGSLIGRPKTLTATSFDSDGPILPIQFSRVSRSGSVTLVKDLQHGIPVKTWFAMSTSENLDQAIKNLMEREETVEEFIGFLDLRTRRYRISHTINTKIEVNQGHIQVFSVMVINLNHGCQPMFRS